MSRYGAWKRIRLNSLPLRGAVPRLLRERGQIVMFWDLVRRIMGKEQRKSATEILVDDLCMSLRDDPGEWKALEFGKPFLVIDGVERKDRTMSVCVDLHGKYVRIQPAQPWGTTIRPSGVAEWKMKSALRTFHRNWEERKAEEQISPPRAIGNSEGTP